MKLCRFELRDDPGMPRSGIYHDGRYYETDGERAVGIHDPGAVRLLSPTGHSPALRLFETARLPDGDVVLSYAYKNPVRAQAPATEIDTTTGVGGVGLDVRLALIVQETPVGTDPFDAAASILGYCLYLSVVDLDERERLYALGASPAPAEEHAALLGPFLVTPEEMADVRKGSEAGRFAVPMDVQVNGETIYHVAHEPGVNSGELVAYACARAPLAAGEVLAFPSLDVPALETTVLGRGLLPTDTVSVEAEPLGTLTGRIV